jgi:uncharacterized protein (TIGR00255 family)
MAASMTAFARKQQEYEWGTLSWEIRSVNHRYLEPGLRLPELLRPLEPAIRDALRKAIARGKVDCQVRIQTREEVTRQEELNFAIVGQLSDMSQQVRDIIPDASPLSINEILRWPGVLLEHEIDASAILTDAMALLHSTLAEFNTARQREGDELAQLIRQRLHAINAIVASIRERLPEILQRQQDNIRTRLDALKTELDPARLEQEIVLLAQKADVDEELDRLATHVAEVERVLGTHEPIGRRLDFLMQELNREANTLSSKSIVAETTMNAVELKVLIEQMREQIQNIE